MAPITPFLTDHVWNALRTPDAPESVHLARWPEANPALIDEELSAQMALTRRLVELGRSARATATVKTRQPLARALVGASGFASLPAELRAQVAEELNVHALEPLASVGGDLVDYTVKPNYRALGRRFGKTRRRWPRPSARLMARNWPPCCARTARPRWWWTASRSRSARTRWS